MAKHLVPHEVLEGKNTLGKELLQILQREDSVHPQQRAVLTCLASHGERQEMCTGQLGGTVEGIAHAVETLLTEGFAETRAVMQVGERTLTVVRRPEGYEVDESEPAPALEATFTPPAPPQVAPNQAFAPRYSGHWSWEARERHSL